MFEITDPNLVTISCKLISDLQLLVHLPAANGTVQTPEPVCLDLIGDAYQLEGQSWKNSYEGTWYGGVVHRREDWRLIHVQDWNFLHLQKSPKGSWSFSASVMMEQNSGDRRKTSPYCTVCTLAVKYTFVTWPSRGSILASKSCLSR